MSSSARSLDQRTTTRITVLKYSVGLLFAGRLLKLEMQVRTQTSLSINSPKYYMRQSYRWVNATQPANWINDENSTESTGNDGGYLSTEEGLWIDNRNSTQDENNTDHDDNNILDDDGYLNEEADGFVDSNNSTQDENNTDTDKAPYKSPLHSTTDIKSNHIANNKMEQRIIILPGPHKSATTSVQHYIVKLAKEKVLSKYNWSWVGGKESITGFADISRYLLYEQIEKRQQKVELVRIDTNTKWDDGHNLVIAAEFMDYVASLSVKEARVSIGRLLKWLPNVISKKQIEVVIMYRSPRVSHLISAWKQQTQFRKASTTLPWRISLDDKKRNRKKFDVEVPTLAEWLCYGEYPTAMQYNIETILSAQINPFGVAYAYSTYGGMDITMLDMTGVPNSDVPSSVVCDILGLPCDNGKLAVGQKTESEQKNHKVSFAVDTTKQHHLISRF